MVLMSVGGGGKPVCATAVGEISQEKAYITMMLKLERSEAAGLIAGSEGFQQ